jgi:predicted ArsR family transcriptional regulator
MTTKLEILRDLLAGQSSPSALAERIPLPADTILSHLLELEATNHVLGFMISDTIHVFKLTETGKTLATTPNSKIDSRSVGILPTS